MTVAVTSQHELSRNLRTTTNKERIQNNSTVEDARIEMRSNLSRGASIAAVAATKEAVAEEAVDEVDDGEINESGLVPRVE